MKTITITILCFLLLLASCGKAEKFEVECTVDTDCGEVQKCGLTWRCMEGECHQFAVECPLPPPPAPPGFESG